MPRNISYDEFRTRNSKACICLSIPGNIKFASGSEILWQNESTRFVHQCSRGTSVMWPSHARDWSRQHNHLQPIPVQRFSPSSGFYPQSDPPTDVHGIHNLDAVSTSGSFHCVTLHMLVPNLTLMESSSTC
jgi:hypothetical protein